MEMIKLGETNFIKLYNRFTPLHLKILEHNPKKPAIYYFDDVISYEKLIDDALTIASYLKNKGIKPGDRIALYLQNIPQFVIAEVASWFVGGVVVPLNIMFKSKELEFYLSNSGAKAIFGLEKEIESNLLPILEKTNLKIIITTNAIDYIKISMPNILKDDRKTYPLGKDNDFIEIIKENKEKLKNIYSPNPEDPALISYTSGITGPPKGAVNTHYNILFAANSYKEIVNLNENDVTISMVPLFHIGGNISFLATSLYTGIPLILMYRFDPGEALRLIEKWKATYTANPITIYVALMNHPDFLKRNISSFTKLGHGAMAAPPSIIDQWEKLTGVYIHNSLGMTEAASIITVVPFDQKGPVDKDTNALTVGKPIPGTEVKIIDPETGKELNKNELGEIVIKGPNIIKYYWNNLEETNKAFINDWFRTGDLGKIDENGWIYFIDRVKDIIDVSGYKIWPREVEDVLYMHPAVKEAAVVGKPDEIKGEIPKAYIVLKNEYIGKINGEEIKNFVKKQLASYKVPQEIEFLNELPKAPVGKILRRELKKYK
jgi:long-chain acyl-CoA synthetase